MNVITDENYVRITGDRKELMKLKNLIDFALSTCTMVEEMKQSHKENDIPEFFAKIHPFSDYFDDTKIEIGCE